MNIRKLRGKMVEKGLTVESLATDLGVTKSTMYRKLSAGAKITIEDAQKIKESLKLTGDEARDIFFGE
jgi:transcriptional regulator with XRE-family HTH domain